MILNWKKQIKIKINVKTKGSECRKKLTLRKGVANKREKRREQKKSKNRNKSKKEA